MGKTALITGLTGFVGSHLAEYLLAAQKQVAVHGLLRWRSPRDHIIGIQDQLGLHFGDLRDLGSLIRVFGTVKPDYIFHLAAQSFVPTSFNAPADTMDCNVIGTTNLLEAVRITGIDPVIHICSSSEVYGQVTEDDLPITEDCPLRPVSPYAVSKVGEDMVAYMYYEAYGIKTIRSRMFTHSGPRRGSVFVDSAFCYQLAKIEAGRQDPVVKVGNLDSVRTFADVRDTVRAYWDLVTKGVPGEVYNIGGEETMTIREMLGKLLTLSKMQDDISVQVDPSLLRPKDVTLQIPSPKKFKDRTGWEPRIPYDQCLRDMLDYWRDQVSRGLA